MSVHQHFDNPEPVARLDTAPIVLRFEQLFPRDLKRREMHRKRKGGDLSHIRHDLTGLNYRWVAEEGWIDDFLQTVETVAGENLQNEIEAREGKRRWTEVERIRLRGLVDPWKFTKKGPLREGILTVNKDWFGGTGIEEWDPERVAEFMDRVLEFLRENFPDDQLLEVDSHVDEEAFHVHFVVGVWTEKVSQNRGRQVLLQPSVNPLIERYEHAQDVAGEAFLDLGIHRGERRAAAAREARAAGLEAPSPRRHITPSKWRETQRLQALEDRDRIRKKTQAEAAQLRADAGLTAKATVKKSRKRAIKEAQARKEQADQILVEANIALMRGHLAEAFRCVRIKSLAEKTAELEQRRSEEAARIREMEARAQVLHRENAQADARAAAARGAQADAEAARIAEERRAKDAARTAEAHEARATEAVARADIADQRAELARAKTALAEKEAEVQGKWVAADRLLRVLQPLIEKMTSWLRRAGLSADLAEEGKAILRETHKAISTSKPEPKPEEEGPEM